MDNQQRLASSSVLVNLLVLLSVEVLYVSTTSLSFNFVDNQQLLTVSFFRDFGACQQLHDSSFFDHFRRALPLTPKASWCVILWLLSCNTTETKSFTVRHSLVDSVHSYWWPTTSLCVILWLHSGLPLILKASWCVILNFFDYFRGLLLTPTASRCVIRSHTITSMDYHIPTASMSVILWLFFIECYANGFQMCHSLITFVDYRW